MEFNILGWTPCILLCLIQDRWPTFSKGTLRLVVSFAHECSQQLKICVQYIFLCVLPGLRHLLIKSTFYWMLNCQDCLCVKSGEVAMERLMLLCDSCVRTGIKMVTVMSIPIKKRIPNSFIKKENFYFFLSCHSAKNNRRGNIGFCKEADNRASCLHCEWQESSYQFARGVMVGPLSPDWLLPGRALSFFLSVFSSLPPSFLPSFPPSLPSFLLSLLPSLPSFLWPSGHFWLWPNISVGWGTRCLSPPCGIHPAKQGPRTWSGPTDYKQV